MTDTTPDKPTLDQLQRWLLTVITHPLGAGAGTESNTSREILDVPATSIEQVIPRSRTLDGLSRLSVYADAYYARLLEVMAAEFPAFVLAVGQDTFRQFVLGYLQDSPSTSYTLADLGAAYPAYLERTRPVRSTSHETPDWADFLVDLARLERTYSEVFDGPGTEEQALLSPNHLSGVSPEAWAEARVRTVPCLRLLELRFPVHEFATAVRRGESASPPEPVPTWLVITRRKFVVRRTSVSAAEYAALAVLDSGGTTSAAIAAASDCFNGTDAEFGASLRLWFRHWTEAGYFVEIITPTTE